MPNSTQVSESPLGLLRGGLSIGGLLRGFLGWWFWGGRVEVVFGRQGQLTRLELRGMEEHRMRRGLVGYQGRFGTAWPHRDLG